MLNVEVDVSLFLSTKMTWVMCGCRLSDNQLVKNIGRVNRKERTSCYDSAENVAMSAPWALAVTIWVCTPLSQTHLNPFPCLILALFCRRAHILAMLSASSLSAWPLVGCWIQASGEPANESAPCTQPCIWQLHGTTCMCVHLSCCSCANQIIPGVRLIDAFCPPSHSFLWEVLACHGLLQGVVVYAWA